MAIGLGRDLHRLVPGRRLVLGGVEIPHSRGLLGHSDGDVVLHAVIDALLGAAGLGDIGRKFPDTDPAYKDVSSEALLARVMEDIRPRWIVVNADVTIVAEAPRLAPHAAAMAARIGRALGTDRVSIKAKTNEGLGPVGAGEAIECLAVVELAPRGSP
jgi:2-C-methyl-D-erythritol 2,4-cyclodiphosphate synthase